MWIQEFVYVLLVKSGILGFGIWDTAPINDWNPESKIHKVESRIQDCLVFPPIGRLLAYFSVVIFLGKLLMPNDGNSQPDWYPPLPTDVRGDWLGWYIQIEQDEKCLLPPLPALHLEFYWKWVLSDETVTVCIFGRGGVDSVFDL